MSVGYKFFVDFAYALFKLADTAQLCLVAQADVGPLVAVLYAEHLTNGVQGAEIDAAGHRAVVHVAQSIVGRTRHTDIEQRWHQAGDVLRHCAAQCKDKGGAVAAQMAAGHHLQVVNGLLECVLQTFGMVEGLGCKDAEVGDRIAVAGEVHKHTSFVAYLLVGEVALRKGGDQFVGFDKGVVRDVVYAFTSELLALLLQLVRGVAAVALVEQHLQEPELLFAVQLQQTIHVVPTRRELVLDVARFTLETVYYSAWLVAFELVGRVFAVVIENLAPFTCI